MKDDFDKLLKKRIVVMQDWELYFYKDRYNLSGNADDHPKLGKNAYVRHTSRLVDYRLEDDILTYETRNTIYRCPLKYMSNRPYRGVNVEYKNQLINRVNDKSTILDRIIAVTVLISMENVDENHKSEELRKESYKKDELFDHITSLQIEGQREIEERENNLKEHLIKMAKNYEDCIYIEMSNISSGDTLAYNISGCTGIIEPYVHVGMFQDSVLYMQYQEEEDVPNIDFRYFPKGFSDVMETYDWSDNILNVVIRNDCTFAIRFNGENIEIGETRKFTPKKASA